MPHRPHGAVFGQVAERCGPWDERRMRVPISPEAVGALDGRGTRSRSQSPDGKGIVTTSNVDGGLYR